MVAAASGATAVSSSEYSIPKLAFKQVMAVLKMNITNIPVGHKVTAISLSTVDNTLNPLNTLTSASNVRLNGGTLQGTATKSTLTAEVLNAPYATDDARSITADFALLPVTMGGEYVYITVTTQDSEGIASYHIIKKSGTSFQRNTIYSVTVNLDNEEDPESLSDLGRANCYIVKHAGNYKFAGTVVGNGHTIAPWTFSPDSPVIDPDSAELLWEDTDGLITNVRFDNSYIYFTASASKGNAVIVAKNSDGILWSWHIWCTEQPGSVIYTTRSWSNPDFAQKTIEVMDRNLGAITNKRSTDEEILGSLGLLYQWGRKDPFPNTSSLTAGGDGSYPEKTLYDGKGGHPVVKMEVNSANYGDDREYLKNGWMNPLTFYMGSSETNWKWYGSNANNQCRENGCHYLWGNQNGYQDGYENYTYTYQKTIYDPCPPGWRVAPKDTWTRFVPAVNSTSPNADGSFDKGFAFRYNADSGTNTDFYVAAGQRRFEDGKLHGIGSYLYYWSSAFQLNPDEEIHYNGGALVYYDSNVTPMGGECQANAQSVRCIDIQN